MYPSTETQTYQVLSLLKEAAELGVKHVNYTGGEPLLRKDIVKLIEETFDLGIEASLFTNLTLMDEARARELSRLDLYIMTSLDGPKEVYEEVKGPGTWDMFLRGLRNVRDQGIPFHINIPVSMINCRSIGDALRTASLLGASSISLIPTMNPKGGFEWPFINKYEFLRALHEASEVSEELGIRVSVWCTPFLEAIGIKGMGYSNCREWGVMDISPSGKVLLCDVMGIEVADLLRDGVLGSWRKLLEHPLYQELRKPPRECTCPFSRRCLGGCYARAYNKFGRLPSPDPLCPIPNEA